LSASKDGVIRLYADGKLSQRATEYRSHTGSVNMLATTAAQGMEDVFASVSADKSLRVWDIR